jgi:hypothetical protein
MSRERSLDAEHDELARRLDEVIACGRGCRWADYRLGFGQLREALAQHMAYEEETLFPLLEKGREAEVAALREVHARLREHLDIVGAAAPEHDPEGCLGELDQLAALLREHHSAEQALDPEYATRKVPEREQSPAAPMDLRGLQPPEPILRIFQALESNPGAPLRVILPHEPVPLYGLLRERGYTYAGSARPEGGFEVLIERT